MGRANAHQGRVSSGVLLTLATAAIASGAAIYVLYAAHGTRLPDTGAVIDGSISGDNMSAEERRELTRQMLKARRENPEIPEEVHPTPPTRAATTGTGDRGVSMDSIRPRFERTGTAGVSTQTTRTSPVRRLDTASSSNGVPAQGAGSSLVPSSAQPMALDSVAAGVSTAAPPVVSAIPGVTPPALVLGASGSVGSTAANGGPPTESAQRGFAGNVFSSLSGIAGTAANVTGNTVNWVIDLPGRAISASGRLLGGGSTPNPPAAAQSPAQSGPPASPVQEPVQSGSTPKRNNL